MPPLQRQREPQHQPEATRPQKEIKYTHNTPEAIAMREEKRLMHEEEEAQYQKEQKAKKAAAHAMRTQVLICS